MAVIAQAELVGRPFNRITHLDKGESVVDFAHQSCVRVAALFNTATGDVSFRNLHRLPSEISSFPHLPLHGTIYDSAWYEGQSLENVLKQGASTRFVDTIAAIIARGGTLESILKEDGFQIARTREEIAKERERKKTEVTFGPEVAAVFQGAKKHSEKVSGFFSSRTALDLVKKRHQKQYWRREATKERKNIELTFP